jgi:hypothetical protein
MFSNYLDRLGRGAREGVLLVLSALTQGRLEHPHTQINEYQEKKDHTVTFGVTTKSRMSQIQLTDPLLLY